MRRALTLLLIVLAPIALTGCGDGEAEASPSWLDEDASTGPRATMRTMGAALDRLEAWSANDWKRPAAAPATLGGSAVPLPDELAELVALLDAGMGDLTRPAAGEVLAPHFDQRQDDARLAVRLLAANLQRGSMARATAALGRVRAACAHCHDRCGR